MVGGNNLGHSFNVKYQGYNFVIFVSALLAAAAAAAAAGDGGGAAAAAAAAYSLSLTGSSVGDDRVRDRVLARRESAGQDRRHLRDRHDHPRGRDSVHDHRAGEEHIGSLQ